MRELIRRASAVRAPTIALVTASEALGLDEDMPPLVAALRGAGATVATPCWDDSQVDWAGYDLALLRSTWDYTDRIGEFLAWCERCAMATRLLNPLEVVRWNIDKHYLLHLARRGVPVVPTRFVEPGEDAGAALGEFLAGGASSLTVGAAGEFAEFVVKPAIGAGSRDAARYLRGESERALAHLVRLLAADRSVLLQPYLERVDERGETAVLYLGGGFSHSARKGPLLQSGAALVEGLFAPEDIRARDASPAELETAAAAFAAIPFAPPLYARIDLLHDADGAPAVLELELTEPSLFLAHAPGAAEAFAWQIVGSLKESSPSR